MKITKQNYQVYQSTPDLCFQITRYEHYCFLFILQQIVMLCKSFKWMCLLALWKMEKLSLLIWQGQRTDTIFYFWSMTVFKTNFQNNRSILQPKISYIHTTHVAYPLKTSLFPWDPCVKMIHIVVIVVFIAIVVPTRFPIASAPHPKLGDHFLGRKMDVQALGIIHHVTKAEVTQGMIAG